MGNKQSRREQEVRPSSRKDGVQTTSTFIPSTHTLSSLKANKSDGYTFTIPKNTNFWDNMTTESCRIGGDKLGDRKFVPVDRTRCMLRHKGKTEAILLRNQKTQTIHICSFMPPGNEKRDGHPLFEWGVIGKSKNKKNSTTTHCRSKIFDSGYTMATPFDGSYSVRGVTMPSSSSSNQGIKSSNSNNNNTMVVTSSQNGDNKTCATFEETDDKWICHTMYGIDPIMMVCSIVALDTLRGNSSNRGSRFSLLTLRNKMASVFPLCLNIHRVLSTGINFRSPNTTPPIRQLSASVVILSQKFESFGRVKVYPSGLFAFSDDNVSVDGVKVLVVGRTSCSLRTDCLFPIMFLFLSNYFV